MAKYLQNFAKPFILRQSGRVTLPLHDEFALLERFPSSFYLRFESQRQLFSLDASNKYE